MFGRCVSVEGRVWVVSLYGRERTVATRTHVPVTQTIPNAMSLHRSRICTPAGLERDFPGNDQSGKMNGKQTKEKPHADLDFARK